MSRYPVDAAFHAQAPRQGINRHGVGEMDVAVYWLHLAATKTRTAQDNVLRRFTERLLTDAGIARACGLSIWDRAGDVALIAAKAVGTTGEVIGIDRNSEVLEPARRRAADLSHLNVSFYTATETEYCHDHRFDIVIDRFVPLHQTNRTNSSVEQHPSWHLRAS